MLLQQITSEYNTNTINLSILLKLFSERHFGLIHESLNYIKEKLRKLEQNQVSPTPLASSHVATVEENSPYALQMTFQGESSVDSHSTQAALSAELSAREPNIIDLDDEVQSSLSAIKSFLKGQNLPSAVDDLCFPNFAPGSTKTNAELPPMSAVLAVLKMTSG